ncbi:Methylmalonyl-CoA mutase small subunit [Tenacibaculum maritimum]|uniref:methylmalonyl-CoA mutase subunit beta n=1 Tax=Tenacibaculum maritimum TaxID=107401 RepID=UPI0012E4F5B5|nr:methylmalonyl-CoA mutase subunit beta [Tenacibaculum maritimum]CAA0173854.1 Methylmalonyl-CoA mutase small subunit [Tenacibaculum maritimum]CAA0179149.1 Methylmalonyl-CoA mutase small subunit [Tenacibaculum maritimum]
MSNIFSLDFEKTTANAWKQKIQVDLKGADYNNSLLWQTDENITVKPFYTKEDRFHQNIQLPEKGFSICQTINIQNEIQANTLANDALQRGANSIQFIALKEFDYVKVLKNIDNTLYRIYFKLHFLSATFIKKLTSFCNSENTFLQIDIIGNLAETGNWFFNLKKDHEAINQIINTNNSINVNASLYQNSGANITQQLAYALAHGHEYLNYFGGDIAPKIHFNFSIGSNYFFEIAKLRAFRVLWTSILNEYHVNNTTTHIFSQPSLRNKTLYDYNVNMLRTTSECMSAILGGSDTIANISYDKLFHIPNEFGERISRNQLLILQQESYLSKAQNFADGAYYIESITQQLANKALDIFKQIEKGGGFLKQLKEGVIQRKISVSALKEQEKFNHGELALLGTNKIQNTKDQMKHDLQVNPFVKIRNEKTLIIPITPKRLAEILEKERLQNE